MQSPVHSESSVMYRLHGNVMIHILNSVTSAILSSEVQVRRAVLEGFVFFFFFCELLECFKMGNLNCFGGRFLLIL